MIRDVFKYLILGTNKSATVFFERAQEKGFLEFITLSKKKIVQTPAAVQIMLQAIKILKKQPHKAPYEGSGDVILATQLAERTIELKEDLEKLQEEKRALAVEKIRVAPFGRFSMDDIHAIEKLGNRKVQFFCMKTSRRKEITLPSEILYVASEYDLDYFISIGKMPISPPGMIEMRIEASLGEIQDRLDFITDAHSRIEHELKAHAAYIDFLEHVLVEELNSYHLQAVQKEIIHPLENSLFFIEAWVPDNKVTQLRTLANECGICVERVAIDKKDRVPTCLDNRGINRIGEDLIKVYDTPSITDKDPSSWVLWFFVIFFAIIVGDAGYGLLFLALTLYIKKKFPHLRGEQKRMLKLVGVLSGACIVWGVIISSYFGMKLSPDNFFSKISPLHALVEGKADYHLAKSDDVYHFWEEKYPSIAKAHSGKEMLKMVVAQKKALTSYPMIDEFTGNIILEFTIILGVIHLSLSFLRYLRRNVAGLGWVCFMIGGYLYFPMMLHATTIPEFMGWISMPTGAAFGLQCLYGGLGFALIVAVIQHRMKGLGEIANMVQVFADVLSYLRLYALSLAGAIMASTFNQEGSALGLFLGFLVVLAGHGINMLLAVMGGVIHGLRLNFLEWYHYCFDGGGKIFKPLRKLKLKS